ncbi:hypothetical protein R1flu_024575 [Riccia fluitans]|uniref:Uncharacterized protein n=1 Tax=Riccia fluitans TaxID=41844 RepID=A0ABD1XZD6_9MARC
MMEADQEIDRILWTIVMHTGYDAKEKESATRRRKLTLPGAEKSPSRTEEIAIEEQQIKTSTASCQPPLAETFSATYKNGPETHLAAEKPQKIRKANLKQKSEQSRQGVPCHKRRDQFVQPPDHMLPPMKVVVEKKGNFTEDFECRSNKPYLQRYLMRESLVKPAIIQDEKAVKRRGTRMWQLALELPNELTRDVAPLEDLSASRN